MKQHSKLHQKEEQGNQALNPSEAASKAKEFSSVEELLRFDASQNPPPASLAERVSDSIAKELKRERSFWDRIRGLFSK